MMMRAWHVIGQARLLIIQGSFSFGLDDLNLVDLLAKVPNGSQMVRLVNLNQANLYKAACMLHVHWTYNK